MPIDFAFVHSCAQGLAVMVLMLIIFVVRKQLGSRWISWGFQGLLLTVLLRRVDEIGLRFGVDVFGSEAMTLLSWVVIAILFVLFIKAWRRRFEIKRVEAGLRAREEYLETLRKNHERGMSWDQQHKLNV